MCPHQHSPKESRNSPIQGACWSSYRIKDSCQFVTCMVCFGYFCYRKFDCCLSCFVSSFSLKSNKNRKPTTILEWQLRNKKQMTLRLSCLDVFFSCVLACCLLILLLSIFLSVCVLLYVGLLCLEWIVRSAVAVAVLMYRVRLAAAAASSSHSKLFQMRHLFPIRSASFVCGSVCYVWVFAYC